MLEFDNIRYKLIEGDFSSESVSKEAISLVHGQLWQTNVYTLLRCTVERALLGNTDITTSRHCVSKAFVEGL